MTIEPLHTGSLLTRLDAYSTRDADGAVHIDAEAVAVDLIAALKLMRVTREEFLRKVAEIWDEIEITIIGAGGPHN